MAPTETKPLSQLRRRVLEYCVLSLLSDTSLYAFDLVRRLSDSDGMVISEGVYPLPSRLRREGWPRPGPVGRQPGCRADSPPCVATTLASTVSGQAISGQAISGQAIPTQEVCTGFSLAPVLGIASLLFVVAGPVVVAIVLLNCARSRAALEDQ